MNLKMILDRLGLPKHSHTIYQTIHSHGPLLASQIIARSHVHRPAAYRALRALQKHKFIFTTSLGKRTLYHAANRSAITHAFISVKEKVHTINLYDTRIDTELAKRKITFFHGKDAVRKAFDDVISHTPKGETFYRYTSEKDLNAVNKLLARDYRTRRDEKKLERLVISNPFSGKQKRQRLERFIRYIPEEFDLFQQNIIQLVYGNRLSLIDLNTQTVIIIENKQLAEFQKIIFQQLFKSLSD